VQTVRWRIIEILKANGGATVADLAEQLCMAQVSVRHHLDILIGEDLVQAAGLRRRNGAGRPSQLYVLTSGAARLFPQRHDTLANDVLAEMKALLPDAEFQRLLHRLAERTSHRAPVASAGQSMEERLDDVTEFLTGEGYGAHWERSDEGYVVQACNCPHTGVAERHPELCSMDRYMIRALLPGAVRLESRVLDGSSHCTYVIPLLPSSESLGPEA
jgi:DeoR family transcriptional regulator, suf operon transcriptional repressor